jgi:hypothetical protein
MASSRNEQSISTLVNAIQGGLTVGQSYDLLRQISDDLKTAFNRIEEFKNPYNAESDDSTFIDPTHIASPGDLPQLVLSQGQVAFLNTPNVFTRNQIILNDDIPSLTIYWNASTTPKKGRMQMIQDGQMVFSCNMYWDGSAWTTDTGDGSGIYFDGAGNIYFKEQIAGTHYNVAQFTTGRVLTFDPGGFSTGALDGEILYKNNRSIRGINAASNALFQMIGITNTDQIVIGANAASTGKGHVKHPDATTANLPAAAAANDGIIAIDKTTNKICWWENGSRFAVAGVAF